MFALTPRAIRRCTTPRLTRQFWPFTKPNVAVLDKVTQWWNKKTPEQIADEQAMHTKNLRTLWDESRVKKAERYFDHIRPRSVDHWNLMIHGHAHMGNIGEARLYFNELIIASELHGVVIDERSYAPMFRAYAERDDQAAVLALLEHMRSRNLSLGPACYAGLLAVAAKKGDIAGAEQLLSKMIEEGVLPTILHLNSVMQACGTAADLDRMEGYFEDLKQWNLEPSDGTYSIMILAHGKKNLNKATQIFASLGQSHDAKGTVHSMLHVLADHQASIEIDNLLETMPTKYGMKLDRLAFDSILKPLGRKGNVVLSLHYYERMRKLGIQPSLNTYNYLISAHVNKGRRGGVVDFGPMQELFNEMTENKFRPNIGTASLMLQACAFNGQQDRVESLLKEMESALIALDENIFCLILLAYAQVYARNSTDKARCKACLARTLALMQDKYKVPLTLKVHNIVLLGLGEAKLVDDMLQHLAYMQSSGVEPDIVTHNTVIEGLIKSGQLRKAWDHFESLVALGIRPTSSTRAALGRLLRAAISSSSEPGKKDHYPLALRVMFRLFRNGNNPHILKTDGIPFLRMILLKHETNPRERILCRKVEALHRKMTETPQVGASEVESFRDVLWAAQTALDVSFDSQEGEEKTRKRVAKSQDSLSGRSVR